MIANLKKKAAAFKNNWSGWSTKRKILVIESDDWGNVRIPNKSAFDTLLTAGIKVNKCPFLTFDNFEQVDDFQALFETMKQIRNTHGKSPKITANYIMSNPDLKAIEASGFAEYNFITIKEKLQNENALIPYLAQIEIGKNEKWFHPQLHGREHVNIGLWMRFLQDNSRETRFAFENGIYGISSNITSEKRRSFLPALDYENEHEWQTYTKPSLIEGQQLFKEFFGFHSKSFIAPNYTWDSKVEEVLSQNQVKFLQSSANQVVSTGASSRQGRYIAHKTGDVNAFDQTYIVRNAIFEPSTVKNKRQHLEDCLYQINVALLMNKPAILSMHRLNFMGGLHAENRDENLLLFKELIDRVLVKHPKLEFMSTDELGDLITQHKND